VETADFVTIGGRSDREHGEPPIDTHPATLLAAGAPGMAPFAVKVRSTDVEAHIPPDSVPADGGEHNLGQRRDHTLTCPRVDAFGGPKQPSQSAGVVVHSDRPESG
jgi:hypothetical protein